jgi:hypothetical protein
VLRTTLRKNHTKEGVEDILAEEQVNNVLGSMFQKIEIKIPITLEF